MSVVRNAARLSVAALKVLTRVTVALAATALTVGMGAIALLPNVGARAMIVTSGSMEPTIDVGGLAIVEEIDPATIAVGDVITYRGYTTEGLTTHRVIDRKFVNGRLHFRTQGDANDTPDVDLAPAEGVAGKVRFDVPHAGRALHGLSGPEVRYVGLGGASMWLMARNALALRRALRARVVPTGKRDGATPAASGIAAAVVVVVAAAAITANATSAVLNDATAVTDNTFATGTW